jgi:glycosyltransferase involved in cell wall biosynthesis
MPDADRIEPSNTRILLMSTGAGIGGEESFTANLGESLHQRGWDVRVAAVSPVHQEELRRRGLRVETLPIGGRSPRLLLAGARALARYARDERIDVLHAQCAGPAIMSILARELRFFSRPRPAILWHDHGITHYGILSKIFNRLDISIANSDFERNKLMANGLRSDRVVRIHNGIDMAKLTRTAEDRAARRSRIRAEFGLAETTPLAGFVGRLSPEKAPDDFVASFRRASELLPDIRYLVVGDGPMRPAVEEIVRGLSADGRIILAGFRRDVPDLLCAIDVLALVSHMETFSLTTLEAMASRVPCVVTRVGGSPEQVVDGENGRVVPDRSPDQIAEALVDILKDPKRREAYGAAGYERVHGYLNRDRMVDEIEAVYRDTVLRLRPRG